MDGDKESILHSDSLVILEELNRSAREDTDEDDSRSSGSRSNFGNLDKVESLKIEPETIVVRSPIAKMTKHEKDRYERMMNFGGYMKCEEEATTATLFALHRVKTFSKDVKKIEKEIETQNNYTSLWRNKVNIALPNVAAVKHYETLFLQMSQIFDVTTTITNYGDPVASRLIVCLCCAALEMEKILLVTLDLYEEQIPEREDEEKDGSPIVIDEKETRNQPGQSKKKSRKPSRLMRQGDRGLGVVGRRMRRMTVDGNELFDNSSDYARQLFKKSSYIAIEEKDRHPLHAAQDLRNSFHELAETCAKFSNEFYERTRLFKIVTEFESVNMGSDIDQLMNLAEERLLLCHGIYRFFIDDIQMNPLSVVRQWDDYRQVLRELDLNELSFLYPMVLPNVKPHDPKLVTEGKLDFLRHLSNEEKKFMANISASNLLYYLEKQVLTNEFTDGITVKPLASKAVNRRTSVLSVGSGLV